MSLKPAKIYPFTIGAYEALPLLVQGSYFKIASSTGVLDVTGDTFGTIEGVLAGQGLRGHAFQRLTLRDRSGAANVVRLLVADELFVDDRITGEVSVIDGNKARSIAGAAMAWRISSYATVAGNRALSQIWNPAGSGRRIIVDAMLAGGTMANDLAWGLTSVMLGGLSGDAIAALSGVAAPGTAAQARVQEQASFPATAIAGGMFIQANVSQRVRFERPFVVLPGTGFLVGTGNPGVQTITGSLEFFEESIL